MLRPDDLGAGQIGDVTAAEEGQEVVLAEAVDLHVADDDHLVVLCLVEGVANDVARVDGVTASEERERAGDPVRRIAQAVAARVFAQLREKRAYGAGQGRRRWGVVSIEHRVSFQSCAARNNASASSC